MDVKITVEIKDATLTIDAKIKCGGMLLQDALDTIREFVEEAARNEENSIEAQQ